MNKLRFFLIVALFGLAISQISFSGSITGQVGAVNPPNGVVQVSISPLTDTIIAQNTVTWTATVTPGTPPYSYTWNIYAYNGMLWNTVTYPNNGYTTNQFTYQFNFGQTWYATVAVVDAVPNTATSANSVITVCYPNCGNSISGGISQLFWQPIQVKVQNNEPAYAAIGLALFFGLLSLGLIMAKPQIQEPKKPNR